MPNQSVNGFPGCERGRCRIEIPLSFGRREPALLSEPTIDARRCLRVAGCAAEAILRFSITIASNNLSHAVYLFGVLALTTTACAPKVNPMINQDEQNPWVIRTEFSHDEEWSTVRELIAAPQIDIGQSFYAYVKYVSDEKYAGMEPETLVYSLPEDYSVFFCFIVDDTTFKSKEHPILVVGFSPNSIDPQDYERAPKQTPSTDIKTFRAIPSTIQGIENNLSIANMDFEDFANSVDDDGVFRGFPQ